MWVKKNAHFWFQPIIYVQTLKLVEVKLRVWLDMKSLSFVECDTLEYCVCVSFIRFERIHFTMATTSLRIVLCSSKFLFSLQHFYCVRMFNADSIKFCVCLFNITMIEWMNWMYMKEGARDHFDCYASHSNLCISFICLWIYWNSDIGSNAIVFYVNNRHQSWIRTRFHFIQMLDS